MIDKIIKSILKEENHSQHWREFRRAYPKGTWNDYQVWLGEKDTQKNTQKKYTPEGGEISPYDDYDVTKPLPTKEVVIDYYKDKPGFTDIIHKNVQKGEILVIHPDDRSTDFLKPSYEGLNATVITNSRQAFNLRETMKNHNYIIMMGHGSPYGLFMPKIYGAEMGPNHKLKTYEAHSINSTFADILKTKRIAAIWCNADGFVVPHNLHGFYTGMAISELTEANFCGVHGCNEMELEESDTKFALALKEALKIDGPDSANIFKEMYYNPKNPIMVYNRKRIYYR